MSESITEKAKRLEKIAKDKSASKKIHDKNDETVISGTLIPSTDQEKRIRKSGKSAAKITAEAESQIKDFFDRVPQIKQTDIFAGNEFPTLFSRIPLFVPAQRNTARKKQNEKLENADYVELKSAWVDIGLLKAGPPLTTYDEDTLMGLYRFRTKSLVARKSQLPSKKMLATSTVDPRSDDRKVTVHSGYFLVSQLESEIRGEQPPAKGWSGTVISRRRESLKRLSATTLIAEKLFRHNTTQGANIPLITLNWIGDKSDACYYFEIDEPIVILLNEFRTYIDFAIRRQLTPFGKALHRFLASQTSNKKFQVGLEKLMKAIGFEGRGAEAKRNTVEQLEKLKKVGFIKDGKVEGTGRSTPYKLVVHFH